MNAIPLERPQTDPRLKKPVRCVAAKTVDEAMRYAAEWYTRMGWTLPDECYVWQKRRLVELWIPVEVK